MLSKTVQDALEKYVDPENVHVGELLAPLTSFRIGGPCEALVEPENERQLTDVSWYLKKIGCPFFVLGNGSNTLVKDEGYDGVVIHIGKKMGDIRVEGNRIIAGAGALLVQVSVEAAKAGLKGLEFAAGIPGTVGGGVVMNAGAYDGEMKDVVSSVRVLSPDGELLDLENETMEFGYRKSVIRKRDYIVTEVTFELQPGDPEEIQALMKDYNARRREKQPLEFPSAGSTFKRPEGHFAGKLIMDAGLKGYRVGGAQVSEKHCGFVINTGDATARDILTLMSDVQERVEEQFGVRLEPEIVVLG
jgi:UDP-N-acetylmuramate dehydrogenase